MPYLIAYWFLFFQRFLRNPYLLSTSELVGTYFPHWIWMGRKWRARDSIYYEEPCSIPFLSIWYPPNIIASKIASKLSLDSAFRVYAYFILAHYLLGSILAYKTLGLFGAVTLTYAGYNIKLQTPSFAYTTCWIAGSLIPGPFGAFSLGMAVLGGYWPILVYAAPLVIISNPVSAFGLILGLPQIIPFLFYWPRSVRSGSSVDPSFGRVPLGKLLDLIWPSRQTRPIHGVHYPEMALYMGLAPLLIWTFSPWWIALVLALLIAVGLLPQVQRIPARSLYVLSLSIACISSGPGAAIPLCLLQMLLLLYNSSNYPHFPFSEWWDKPSRLYAKFKELGHWPHNTGYLLDRKVSDYRGGFALKAS